MYDLMRLAEGLRPLPPVGCPPSWSPHPVPSTLGSRARALTCFERATGSSLRGSRSLSSPQLKAGVTVHPPSSRLPGAGAWIWPRTCPPSLCRGASRVLKMEKVPHLTLEPLCLPSSWLRESVLGIRPRAPFSPPPISVKMFLLVYIFYWK